MLTLAEFKRRMSAELLDPASAATVYAGCESGLKVQALEVHRRTVHRVWENALQLTLERAAHAPRDVYSRAVPVGTHMHLRLLGSLNVMRFGYPVDLIRDAVDAARSGPLADLGLAPRTRYLAIWRGAVGATVKAISAASAHFLEGILGDAAAENAIELAVAAAGIPASEVIEAIRAELFTATFLQIIHQPLTGIRP